MQKVVGLYRVSSRGRGGRPELTPSAAIRRLGSRLRVRCLSHVHKRCRRRRTESASCLSSARGSQGASTAAVEKTPTGPRPASFRIAFYANLKSLACERTDPRKAR
jgi:hypothetical protein